VSVRRQRLYLEDLTVSFDGFKALNELSLHVDPGEMLCIIGPNGAGKTTMMDVITGKQARFGSGPVGGDIDLLELSEPEIVSAGIGRKFQKPTVFEQLTVFENLELALAGRRSFVKTLRARISPAQRSRIYEVLDIIGLTDQRDAFGRILAHGQKQWLEIGMLLMQNPELLLVDEPVAGMTPHEIERTSASCCRWRANTRSWWSSTIWPSCVRLPGASWYCTKEASLPRAIWTKCRTTPRHRSLSWRMSGESDAC